jgi:acyl-homoserine lactone acylase PvdQ
VLLTELYLLVKPQINKTFNLYALHNTQQFVFNYVHEAFRGDIEKQVKMKQAWINMEKKLTDFFKTENSSKWLWGKLHRDVMVHHPFGIHPFLSKLYNRETEGWGNLHTPNVGKMFKSELGNFATSHRANFRSIFDFGGPSWWVIDSGVSENLLSCTHSLFQPIMTINGKYSLPNSCYLWTCQEKDLRSCDKQNKIIMLFCC